MKKIKYCGLVVFVVMSACSQPNSQASSGQIDGSVDDQSEIVSAKKCSLPAKTELKALATSKCGMNETAPGALHRYYDGLSALSSKVGGLTEELISMKSWSRQIAGLAPEGVTCLAHQLCGAKQ